MDMTFETGQSEPLSLEIRRSRGGLTFKIKSSREVEDLIQSWGSGESQDINVHGREWTPVGGTPPLRIYQLNHANAVHDIGMVRARLDAPGKPIGTNIGEIGYVNLSFLRLVGITEGVTFQIRGVFSFEGTKKLSEDLRDALRYFLVSYLKPFTIGVRLVGITETRE